MKKKKPEITGALFFIRNLTNHFVLYVRKWLAKHMKKYMTSKVVSCYKQKTNSYNLLLSVESTLLLKLAYKIIQNGGQMDKLNVFMMINHFCTKLSQ